MVAFYLDEDTPEALAIPLTSLGHTVATTTSAQRKGTKDYDQLWFAALRGLIFVTLNRADYTLLHGAWLHWGVARTHAGIIVLHHMAPSDLVPIAQDIDELVRNLEEFFALQILAGAAGPTVNPGTSVTNHLFRRWQNGRWDCTG